MTELLILIVVVGVAIMVFGLYRRSQASAVAAKPNTAPRSVDPLADWNSGGGDQQFYDLKPGDLVKTTEGDFLIRGTITFDDGGKWYEHLLDDATGNKRWLAVENDEGLEVGLWQRAPMADIESGAPGDRAVVIRGLAYKLIERGTAKYTAVGSTGTATSGSAEYIDYEAANGALLGFEQYDGGPWEVALGRKSAAADFDIYPATTGA